MREEILISSFDEVVAVTQQPPDHEQLQRANTLRELMEGVTIPEESELLDAENLQVKQALQAANFHEIRGFRSEFIALNRNHPPSLSLKLSPPSSVMEKILATSESHWGSDRMKIIFKHNNQDVLHFTCRPKFWPFATIQSLSVDISVPPNLMQTPLGEKAEVGTIIYKKLFGDKAIAIIIDSVSRSTFLISISKVEPYPKITFSDILGMPVAIAKVKVEDCCQFWFGNRMEYFLSFSPEATNESAASAKAVITVGFAMWMMTYHGKNKRDGVAVYIFVLLAIIIFIVIVGRVYTK